MTKPTLRARLRARRPDVAPSTPAEAQKRRLALALRALRKDAGLTQSDVADRARLSQPVVSRLESPGGSLPNWGTVARYVEACDGHILGVSGDGLDVETFLTARAEAGRPAAVAVAM